MHDEPFLIVICGGSITENASRNVLSFGNVSVAPRSPKVIHREYELWTAMPLSIARFSWVARLALSPEPARTLERQARPS